MYVWPYFFAVPLDRLTPRQRVELFKIVTAGDYEDMKTLRHLHLLPRRHHAGRALVVLRRGGLSFGRGEAG